MAYLTNKQGPGTGFATLSSKFQVVKVTKPLWSVSKMLDAQADEDTEVVFRRDKAFIRNSKGTILASAERKGALYVGSYALKNPRHPGFRRPGT